MPGEPNDYRPEFGDRKHKRKGMSHRNLVKSTIRLRRENLELRAQLALVKMIAVLAIRRLAQTDRKNIRGKTNGSDKCGG